MLVTLGESMTYCKISNCFDQVFLSDDFIVLYASSSSANSR